MVALRVVLDTNVLLSGIAYPDSIPGKILTAWQRGSVEVLLSDYILEALRRVLPKLAHRHGLSAIDIDDLVDTLSIQADVIEPAEPEGMVLRDIDGQPVLGTLLAALRSSGADYLITGDRDLLAVAQHYPIISPADFWAAHGSLETGGMGN